MANTVHGPYTTTSWSGSTGINITRLDNLETAADIGVHSLNPNLSGPFVHSGITCTKDGTLTNQLDIASGVAFVTASDGTTIQIDVAADNTHTTSTPSTTYYLFLLNTGAWQWGTTSTGPTNSLPICTVATDGSGNISSVTDLRHTAGSPGFPYVVARDLLHAITTTSLVTLARFTADTSGFYRASMYFTYRNPTPQKVTASLFWGDLTLGGISGQASFTIASSAAVGQIQNGSQASTTGNNQAVACLPITVYAAAGQIIEAAFTDPGGVPNDVVSVVIERIA